MSVTVGLGAIEFTDALVLAAHGFEAEVTPELEEETEDVLRADLIYVFRESDTGELCGFGSFKIWGDLLYLDGIILQVNVRGEGLAKRCVQMARQESGARFFTLRTQSSVMWASGRGLCQEWAPSPENAPLSPELASRVPVAEKGASCRFPVEPAGYGRPLYGNKPLHTDPSVQAWWDSLCNFQAGDAVLCVGTFQG